MSTDLTIMQPVAVKLMEFYICCMKEADGVSRKESQTGGPADKNVRKEAALMC